MLRRRFYLAAATLLCAAPLLLFVRPAQTQPQGKDKPHPIDAFYDACVAKHPSTQGMADCARQAESRWDKQMNSDYQSLLKSSNAKTQAKLRDSQRAWLAFRDKEWAAQAQLYDRQGTMWQVVRADVHMRLIKERALLLSGYRDDDSPH